MLENKFRTIGYCILLAINGLLFYFLHSHFHFVVLIIMVLAPILSVAMNIALSGGVSVEMHNPAGNNTLAKQNEETFITVRIKNRTPFISLDAKLKLRIENVFFETAGEQIIVVPIRALSGYTMSLPLRPTLPGLVRVTAEGLKIKDIMGTHFIKKKYEVSHEFVVLPRYVAEVNYDAVNVEQGMLESDESTKRGSDFSDVSEIREYIPGDKLMSIHWKLSAKRDILMVKDRTSMSDRQIVVVPELCKRSRAQLEMTVTAAYSVIRTIIENNATARLMYYSAATYEYIDTRIDYREDADEAFCKMFYEKTYEQPDEAAINMASVHPEINAYLHITADESGVWMRIRENG